MQPAPQEGDSRMQCDQTLGTGVRCPAVADMRHVCGDKHLGQRGRYTCAAHRPAMDAKRKAGCDCEATYAIEQGRHPTVADLLADRNVRAALEVAWRGSFLGRVFSLNPAEHAQALVDLAGGAASAAPLISVHETGGWIYQSKNTPANFTCVSAGGLAGVHNIDLRVPADPGDQWFVVASYHTHPSPPVERAGIEDRDPWPSVADLENSAINRMPGIVLTWPLNDERQDLSRKPMAHCDVTCDWGPDTRNPTTTTGTVYGYGPARREGWFEGVRGFPKVPHAGGQGFVPLDRVGIEIFEHPLPAFVTQRFQDAIDAVGRQVPEPLPAWGVRRYF